MASRAKPPRHRLTIRRADTYEVVHREVYPVDELEQAIEDEIGLHTIKPERGISRHTNSEGDWHVQISQPALPLP